MSRTQIVQQVRQRVEAWRALLTRHVPDGRQLLRELVGPLRFTPEGKTYRFEGEAAIERLLAGIAGLPTVDSSPAGFDQVFRQQYVIEIAAA